MGHMRQLTSFWQASKTSESRIVILDFRVASKIIVILNDI